MTYGRGDVPRKLKELNSRFTIDTMHSMPHYRRFFNGVRERDREHLPQNGNLIASRISKRQERRKGAVLPDQMRHLRRNLVDARPLANFFKVATCVSGAKLDA